MPFADLGVSPPSNAYLNRDDDSAPEAAYPLVTYACTRCWLVQTRDFVARESMFSPDYAYASSTSTSWLRHAEAFVESAVRRFALGAKSLVAEIGANDGYLLQYVAARGVHCFGVEPTHAVAEIARARGIDIIESFFGAALGEQLANTRGQADLIVANNVLAHVPDINDFVAGIARLLGENGVVSLEFPQLTQLVKYAQFDTIYHEHFSYLSLAAAERVLARSGLKVFDVTPLTTHGGSLRVYAQRPEGRRDIEPSVDEVRRLEIEAGVETPEFYLQFQSRIDGVKRALLAFLRDRRDRGERVAAYGAAAKGNTLFNAAGVGRDLVGYVADRNPAKIGKFLPGSRIPIVAEERLKADRPRWVLILPWNLQQEIIDQLAYIREWGGQFVVAVPDLKIL